MKLNKYYAIDPFSFLAKDVAWMFAINTKNEMRI